MKKLLTLLSSLLSISAAPKDFVLYGQASYYDRSYIGKTMANGRPYDHRAFTLACNDPSVPLGTTVYIEYTNASGSKRTAHATVTDRGPADYLRKRGRYFDLSWQLFNHLENPRVGVINIKVTVLLSKTPVKP